MRKGRDLDISALRAVDREIPAFCVVKAAEVLKRAAKTAADFMVGCVFIDNCL